MKKNEKKLTNFWLRDGRGVDENENKTPGLGYFFKLLWRRIGQLLSLNIWMLLLVIPVLIVILAVLRADTQPVQNHILTAPLAGIARFSEAPSLLLDFHLHGGILGWTAYGLGLNAWIIVAVVLLFLIWGWVNVGATYVLRGIVRGDAVFVTEDFFYAIKRNLWQALGFGVLDLFILVLLGFDFLFFYRQLGGGFVIDLMYCLVCLLIVLYLIMRFYLYPMLVTFDLSLRKMLKNALIFSVLGIKRNVMAILGLIVLVAINVALIITLIPLGVVIPLILPFVHIFSFSAFIVLYAAYPVIEKYMITPYKKNEVSETADE